MIGLLGAPIVLRGLICCGAGIAAKRRLITTYDQLIAELIRRRETLQCSQADVEEACGFNPSYMSHLERPGRLHGRNLGLMSLPVLLQGLGVALQVVVTEREPPAVVKHFRRVASGA